MTTNDFITNATNSIVKKISEDIDKAIIKFCEEKGYAVKTPDDLVKVQNKLAKEDKMIRCETFTKIDDNFNVKQLIFTFIDSISYPLSRKKIYEINKLNEQGYNLYY